MEPWQAGFLGADVADGGRSESSGESSSALKAIVKSTKVSSQMLEKMQREEAAIARLLSHFKSTGHGTWECRRGPDPPDFVLTTPTSGVEAGVEHTALIWPGEEIPWVRALNSVLQQVAEEIAHGLPGLFAFYIQHGDVSELERDFRALSKPERREVAKWLAGELAARVGEMRVGESLVLDGRLKGVLTRLSAEGPCDIGVSRMLARGNDLGYSLAVNLGTGEVKASRVEREHSLLKGLERVLSRKTERLRGWQRGPKVLLIDDWSAGRDNLVCLAKLVTVPRELDEVYIYSLRDSAMFELSELVAASN